MRAADREVIERVGLPGVALMELASAGLAQAILRHHGPDAARGVVIVCGPGNNGGDGYGAARWLKRAGVPVAVLPMSPGSTGDAAVMREAAQRVGVPEVSALGEAGVVVDALFGTGLSRDLDGDALAMVRAIDAHPAVKVAADLPSGLDSDDGHL
jgi:NAD(P)H-hydrate epimerase